MDFVAGRNGTRLTSGQWKIADDERNFHELGGMESEAQILSDCMYCCYFHVLAMRMFEVSRDDMAWLISASLPGSGVMRPTLFSQSLGHDGDLRHTCTRLFTFVVRSIP